MRLLRRVQQSIRETFRGLNRDDRRPRRRNGLLSRDSSAMVQLLEERVLPTSVWVASTQNGAEGGQNGTITLQRDNTAGALMVSYSVAGSSTAQAGSDYTSLPGFVQFANGSNTAVINISVVNDMMMESTESLTINLISGAGGGPAMPGYTLGATASGTIQIADNDLPPNMPPNITTNQSTFTVTHDRTLTVTSPFVSGSDPNGDPITLQLVSGVSHGTLTLNQNATFTYTPSSQYVGPDSFQVRYVDSRGAASSTVTVSLNVTNMPPNITPLQTTFNVQYDRQLSVTSPFVSGNDTDGDALTLQLNATTSHGTLTLNANGTFTYLPSLHYVGTDSFQVAYVDSLGAVSSVVTVTLNVMNQPPQLIDFNVSTTNGTVFTFTGTVIDENELACYVVFDGILAGHQVQCDPNGSFTYTVTLTTSGFVFANAFDPLDQSSNDASVLI